MYRVELKASLSARFPHAFRKFLMYRVELKDRGDPTVSLAFHSLFLMYRVELKGLLGIACVGKRRIVPNVPCGVERKIFQFVSMFRWLL